MVMEEKMKELAAKYDIPKELLKDAMDMEQQKLTLNNRRLVPVLISLIERYADTSSS